MFRIYLFLHLMLMLMSLAGVCNKAAAGQELFSAYFCLYMACEFVLMVIYAIGWQQVIKRLPLITAYANKAATVIWGIIWGNVFFHEPVTLGKVAGSLLVAAGVALYASAKEKQGD